MQSLIVLLLLAGCAVAAASYEDDLTDLTGLPPEVQELIRQDIERRRPTHTPATTTRSTVAALPDGFATPSTEEDPDLAGLPPEIRELILNQRRNNKHRGPILPTATTTKNRATILPDLSELPPEIRKAIRQSSNEQDRMSHRGTTVEQLPPWLLKILEASTPTSAPTTPQPQPQWLVNLERGATTQAPQPVMSHQGTTVEQLPPWLLKILEASTPLSHQGTTPEPLPPWLLMLLATSTPTTTPTTTTPRTTPQPQPQWLVDLERGATTQAPQPVPAHRDSARAAWLPIRCSGRVELRRQPKCSSGRSKWTFNAATGRCEWFAHYGCQLFSGNVFNSRRDCHLACLRGVTDPCSVARCEPISSLHRAECFLARDSICINEILSNFMHIEDLSMRLAIAQGDVETSCQAPVARCRNIGANFRMPTLEIPPVLELPKIRARCRLPPDRGFCPPGTRGRMSRVYFYSLRRNECKFMMHFGCGGNLNKFSSQSDCHNACAI